MNLIKPAKTIPQRLAPYAIPVTTIAIVGVVAFMIRSWNAPDLLTASQPYTAGANLQTPSSSVSQKSGPEKSTAILPQVPSPSEPIHNGPVREGASAPSSAKSSNPVSAPIANVPSPLSPPPITQRPIRPVPDLPALEDKVPIKSVPVPHEVSEAQIYSEDRYIRSSFRAAYSNSGRPRWSIVAWNSHGSFPSLSNYVGVAASKAGISAPLELFTDAFLIDGLPARIMSGDDTAVPELKLDQRIDYLVLVRIGETELPSGRYASIKSIRSSIDVQIISTAHPADSRTLRSTETAGGYNYEDASTQAAIQAFDSIFAEFQARLTGH